jgi:hypothetical protein
VGFGGKIQNLIDSVLECDQAPVDQLMARAGEFVRMTNIEEFRQALIGIETDTVPIGNRDENEIEQFLQSFESLVESSAQEPMIDPTERTADGSNAIRPGRLRPIFDWQGDTLSFRVLQIILHGLSFTRG